MTWLTRLKEDLQCADLDAKMAYQIGQEYRRAPFQPLPVAEIIAVIEAAGNIPSKPSQSHYLSTPGWTELNEALAALKAKIETASP